MNDELGKPHNARTYLTWASKRIDRLMKEYEGASSLTPVDRRMLSILKAQRLLCWALRDLFIRLEDVIQW